MVAADGRGITVAHGDKDVEPGPGQLQAGGEGQGAPVQGVHAVEVHIAGDARGTADARDHAQAALIETELVHCAQQTVQNDAVAASRAPEMGEETLADKVTNRHPSTPFLQ